MSVKNPSAVELAFPNMLDGLIAHRGVVMASATDEELAEVALDAAQSLLFLLATTSVANKNMLHMVLGLRGVGKLAQRSINLNDWSTDYGRIANGKYSITDRTGERSRDVQIFLQSLLQDGDVEYWGSAIETIKRTLDGRIEEIEAIAANSGVQSQLDEFLAMMAVWMLAVLFQMRAAAQVAANV